MVKSKFQEYLTRDCYRTYSCVHCRAHLAGHASLVSKVIFYNVAEVFFLIKLNFYYVLAKVYNIIFIF